MKTSPAKIIRPRLGDKCTLHPRTRLFNLFDAASAQPVTWLSAPPGAGKTTLVNSYLEEKKLKGIWYQVDSGDADPATFFHYLSLAAKQAAPHYRKSLPTYTAEHQSGLRMFARRYFESLFGRMKPPVVWVLDNYQEAAADQDQNQHCALHEIVAEAVSALPQGMRLFVLSRTDPPAAYARLRTHGDLLVIENTAIKLTLDESCAIAKLRNPDLNVDAGTDDFGQPLLDQFHRRSGGWVAGLLLLLEQPHLHVPAEIEAAGRSTLFEYFAMEVFHKLDPRTQLLLCQTALLPDADVALAQRLTNEPAIGNLLSELHRRNSFVSELPRHRGNKVSRIYQFHPLFHEFLWHRAQEMFSQEQLAELRSQAAALLEAAGNTEAAVQLWRAASKWEQLTTLILRQAPALAAQARFQTLGAWLNTLPIELLEGIPWLRYWLGVCQMQRDLDEAKTHFEQAYAGFTRTNDIAGLYLAWAGVVGCIGLIWHDFSPLGPWLEKLEDLRRRHPQWPSPEIEQNVVTAALAAYAGYCPDHPDMRLWLAHARHLLDHVTSSDVSRAALAMHVVLASYWLGESRQAAMTVRSVEQAGLALENAPITQMYWLRVLIVHYWQQLSPAKALQQYDQALAVSQASGVPVMVHGQAFYPALAAGDLPRARELLQAMDKSLPSDSPLEKAHYWALCSLLELNSGEASLAADYAHKALPLAIAASIPLGIAQTHACLAISLHAAGDQAASLAHLTSARHIGIKMDSRQIEHWCSGIEAHAAFAQGGTKNHAAGLTALKRTLTLSREMNGAPLYYLTRAQLVRLYAKALEQHIETEHVCDLISRLGLTPEDLATAPESWPWPIKLYTLGRFEIVIDGKPLRFTGKAQKKPLELLMALVSALVNTGDQGISEARLSETLWGKEAAHSVPTSFAMTLHRLRKLLGDENALLFSNNRLSLNPQKVWVDTLAFEGILNRTEIATATVTPANSDTDVRRILNLYRGPFLSDAALTCTLTPREKLRTRFLRFVGQASQHCVQNARFDEALRLIDKGLEAEPLAEELYFQRMRCQATLGQRAEALTTYRRCQNMLSILLSIEPAEKTQVLYRALLHNQPLP